MDDSLENVLYHYVTIKEMGDLIMHGVPEKPGYVADSMDRWLWNSSTKTITVTYRRVDS